MPGAPVTTYASQSRAPLPSSTSSARNRDAVAVDPGAHQTSGGSASTAPWVLYEDKYRSGDYAWIVTNARSSPAAGSYSFALRVMWECIDLLRMGDHATQVAGLKKASRQDQDFKVRVAALDSMFARCANLGSLEHLQAERARISEETIPAGDAYERMRLNADRLVDPKLPKEQRQRELADLLAMKDPNVALALRRVMTTEGAIFEGQKLGRVDRNLYGLAWEMALCTHFDACARPDAFRDKQRCVLHGECDSMTTAQRVQQMTPPLLFGRVREFYDRISTSLAAENYAAFGVP